jgi:hypothetical protein
MGEISEEGMKTYQDIAHNLLEVGEKEKGEKKKEKERERDEGKGDVLPTTATLGPGKGRPGSRRGRAILKSRRAGREGGRWRARKAASRERREGRGEKGEAGERRARGERGEAGEVRGEGERGERS